MDSEYPLEKTGFSDCLVKCNRLDQLGFEQWAFHPGMLFHSGDRWWDKESKRDRPHEGLDLCFYGDKQGQYHSLDDKTRIPVMYDGEIIKIDDDLLGQSIYVGHSIYDSAGNRLHTIYGHTRPYDSVHQGKTLNEGEIIATIAAAEKRTARIPPHLHLSIAWIPRSFPYERLNWDAIGTPGIITLLDPLKVIGCRYTILKPAA